VAFQVVSTRTADHYAWGTGCEGWFLLRHPECHVIQERMPPATAEVRHLHQRSRQLFYVLSGTLTMSDGSAEVAIPPGHAVVVEPGTPHRASNATMAPVEFLVFSCPPSHGDRQDCP
jgi:mannose-6-phosphate isomerase-like protein (cupin superfamily)